MQPGDEFYRVWNGRRYQIVPGGYADKEMAMAAARAMRANAVGEVQIEVHTFKRVAVEVVT